MYIEGKDCWLKHPNAALEKYNNSVYSAIRMTLFEMPTNNTPIDPINTSIERKQPEFHVVDYVRVLDTLILYSNMFTSNWNGELFQIQKSDKTSPEIQISVYENTEQIKGKYYYQELLGSVFNYVAYNKNLESMNLSTNLSNYIIIL